MRVSLWLFFCFVLASTMSHADEEKNREFLRKIQADIQKNCNKQTGADRINCIVDYTPEKCKTLAYNPNFSGWQYCVYSCGSEGMYSKTFGECSD
jgi:hypothetical protein